jgi:hypothetical protein
MGESRQQKERKGGDAPSDPLRIQGSDCNMSLLLVLVLVLERLKPELQLLGTTCSIHELVLSEWGVARCVGPEYPAFVFDLGDFGLFKPAKAMQPVRYLSKRRMDRTLTVKFELRNVAVVPACEMDSRLKSRIGLECESMAAEFTSDR